MDNLIFARDVTVGGVRIPTGTPATDALAMCPAIDPHWIHEAIGYGHVTTAPQVQSRPQLPISTRDDVPGEVAGGGDDVGKGGTTEPGPKTEPEPKTEPKTEPEPKVDVKEVKPTKPPKPVKGASPD